MSGRNVSGGSEAAPKVWYIEATSDKNDISKEYNDLVDNLVANRISGLGTADFGERLDTLLESFKGNETKKTNLIAAIEQSLESQKDSPFRGFETQIKKRADKIFPANQSFGDGFRAEVATALEAEQTIKDLEGKETFAEKFSGLESYRKARTVKGVELKAERMENIDKAAQALDQALKSSLNYAKVQNRGFSKGEKKAIQGAIDSLIALDSNKNPASKKLVSKHVLSVLRQEMAKDQDIGYKRSFSEAVTDLFTSKKTKEKVRAELQASGIDVETLVSKMREKSDKPQPPSVPVVGALRGNGAGQSR